MNAGPVTSFPVEHSPWWGRYDVHRAGFLSRLAAVAA